MNYNDGDNDYTVYSNDEWANDNAKSIVVTSDYSIESQAIKDWLIDNTNLIENEEGNLEAPQPSSGLAFSVENGEAELTGKGECTDTDIVIPSTYDGYPVTSIGNYAFYNYSSLTSITIPYSVTSIRSKSFSECSSLTSINYQGAIADWEKINKYMGDFIGGGIRDEEQDWDYNTGDYKVYCTDGYIDKDGTQHPNAE